MTDRSRIPLLEVNNLNVFYGQSHALQGVNLSLHSGILSVVGRNGMGKTTLCKSILGFEPVVAGSVSFDGQSIIGLSSFEIARFGIGYVPQGRRLWKSLTVHEHLKLVEEKSSSWSVERVYSIFPQLAERKSNGGSQLSGGEQQMLAIGRALLKDPQLLIMDEPTEGLAPVIVNQVEELLVQLSEESRIGILLIEQNIGVACSVAKSVAIMVNGKINRIIDADMLAADKDLQQSLLGVGRHAHDELAEESKQQQDSTHYANGVVAKSVQRIYISNPNIPTRWSRPATYHQIMAKSFTTTDVTTPDLSLHRASYVSPNRVGSVIYVCGTHDTKKNELEFIRDQLVLTGNKVQMVDVSTSGQLSAADVPPHMVALHHPQGASVVFTGDRGSAVEAMMVAFQEWVRTRHDIAGLIGVGGSGGTALLASGFRVPELGVPKIIVSTLASGDTSAYIDTSDIIMMPSIADIQGLNRVTRNILKNAALALSGMVAGRTEQLAESESLPAIGISMFGVTTPCVKSVTEHLKNATECVVFHATDIGTKAMEDLINEKKLQGIIDISPTDVCDLVAGGVFAAQPTRLDAIITSGMDYIGACGALDMVNFRSLASVPEHYTERNLYVHNPQITLMRTTPEECTKIGEFIGEKLNQMTSRVRFFLPEAGLSALDQPDGPFWYPEANTALFAALENTVKQTPNRQLVRQPYHINDPAFAHQIAQSYLNLSSSYQTMSIH